MRQLVVMMMMPCSALLCSVWSLVDLCFHCWHFCCSLWTENALSLFSSVIAIVAKKGNRAQSGADYSGLVQQHQHQHPNIAPSQSECTSCCSCFCGWAAAPFFFLSFLLFFDWLAPRKDSRVVVHCLSSSTSTATTSSSHSRQGRSFAFPPELDWYTSQMTNWEKIGKKRLLCLCCWMNR